ncbi:hypothetical protein CTAM01_01241 [Colletotrichum tamarilloi]|uniref:Uncharacterized protein n=1 Tax=Colletotrichum tamarilloi TaxID=1209934 RepID=A0ABQ9RQM5_9PEZI|nr:uncharacterized protein CTAM01_01241 [Colletotrichum tamarilloi]KAK1510668.1 hypothetical protein CTAM01_01241 [Colletotrichum tamarilloi]
MLAGVWKGKDVRLGRVFFFGRNITSIMKSLVTFLLSLYLSSRRTYCYTTLPPGGPCLPGMRRTG